MQTILFNSNIRKRIHYILLNRKYCLNVYMKTSIDMCLFEIGRKKYIFFQIVKKLDTYPKVLLPYA